MIALEPIVKVLLNYLSNIVSQALPVEPSEKEYLIIKNSTISVYAISKTFGIEIVESTENEIDDKVLSELIESCEDAAKIYKFSLNAEEL